ncbi:hypothetical protein B0H17DRAFT_1174648 [Mycena rosella]|uniref:Glycosyltransferase 61 catalytic domain-containing protein n=1 Tax=Mycena rosella TaxID=1033263 RepID=A0AAD7GY71_MYCRO|nr:hypothetical protein B0H17DRAFT_1174648 [Mycena rosella]
MFKNVSRRDAILVLAGASCFYTFSALVPGAKSPAIIIDTSHTHLLNAGQTANEAAGQLVTEAAGQTVTETVLLPQPPRTPLDLGLVRNFPETTVVAHAPGWTVFRDLYMSSGALLLLTSDPSKFPPHRLMTSTGLPGNLTNDGERQPTARDMAFVTPEDARSAWGGDISRGERNRVQTVEGTTLLFNDPPQFLNHSFNQPTRSDYHFVAELMFGSWAFLYGVFSDGRIKPPATGTPTEPSFNPPFILTSAPPPINRAIFIHSDAHGWRDNPGFNAYFLRAVFPSMTVEVDIDWLDRIQSTANPEIGRAVHFPLVLLTDRSAAFRGPICGAHTQRTAAEAWVKMARLGKLDLVGNWWSGIRAAMVNYAGGDAQKESHSALEVPDKIVITYINRQGGRRHLHDADHLAMVAAVEELVARKNQEGGKRWEFNNIQAERLSLDEQIKYAANTTILLGVHGNGLTHLVFMKPTRVSAVVEIFLPGGFARDYEWTSRSLGMTHYSVWKDTSFTYPDEPKFPAYPEGFHGSEIPVSGAFVAKLIDEHVFSRERGPPVDNSPATKFTASLFDILPPVRLNV